MAAANLDLDELAKALVDGDVDAVAADGSELLAAVIADPDDLERRLVYADYLLAQGDAQGELIQLWERLRSDSDPSLDERIDELLAVHGQRIAGDVARLASKFWFDRGFVTRVEMSVPMFAEHGERLLDSHPIERLDVAPVSARALARLARVPALARIRCLHLHQVMQRARPIPLDDLCRSPHFAQLRRLELWIWPLTSDPQAGFAGWQAPHLESLQLQMVERTPQILAGLAGNPIVQLRALHFSASAQEWPKLFVAPAFERLERLRIDGHGPELKQMLDGASLPSLLSLAVGRDFVLEGLCFANLRRLRIAGGRVDAASLIAMIERHPRLESLMISTMEPGEVDRALRLALELPSEHPLRALVMPTDDADPELAARVGQRFGVDFAGNP